MSSAVGYPNIALIKYWGKRDERLRLPMNSSLSMTLDIFPTTTTVEADPDLTADTVTVAGVPAPPGFARRVTQFLDMVREHAGDPCPARVDTVPTGPVGAGLASSASGFAALAAAAADAYGLDYDARRLSRLARLGSGSAARSIFGGFVQWHCGSGIGRAADESSYAEPVDAAGLDPAMVVVVLDAGTKHIDSATAMRRTVETSPLYPAWSAAAAADLRQMLAAFAAGDLARVGEIAECNALGMHATMLAARPSIRYLSPDSLRVLDAVDRLRHNGLPAYATMDAGPNVKVWCHRGDAERVAAELGRVAASAAPIVAGPGPDVRLITAVRTG